MSKKVMYIECRHTALVRCKDEKGKVLGEFYPFVINKYTGQPAHTGFTPVDEKALEALKAGSKLFNSFIKQKLLVVREDLPASAMTPQSIIAAKERQIAELKKQLTAAEAAVAAGGISQADVDAAVAKAVEETKASFYDSDGNDEALQAANDIIAEMQVELDDAKDHIAVLEKLCTDKGVELPEQQEKPAEF